jgi:hypothetical protein
MLVKAIKTHGKLVIFHSYVSESHENQWTMGDFP